MSKLFTKMMDKAIHTADMEKDWSEGYESAKRSVLSDISTVKTAISNGYRDLQVSIRWIEKYSADVPAEYKGKFKELLSIAKECEKKLRTIKL